jgi:hypothetical protein
MKMFMRKPAELSQVKIDVEADTKMAVNQIDKMTYAVAQLNKELKLMANLMSVIDNPSVFSRVYKFLTKSL